MPGNGKHWELCTARAALPLPCFDSGGPVQDGSARLRTWDNDAGTLSTGTQSPKQLPGWFGYFAMWLLCERSCCLSSPPRVSWRAMLVFEQDRETQVQRKRDETEEPIAGHSKKIESSHQ